MIKIQARIGVTPHTIAIYLVYNRPQVSLPQVSVSVKGKVFVHFHQVWDNTLLLHSCSTAEQRFGWQFASPPTSKSFLSAAAKGPLSLLYPPPCCSPVFLLTVILSRRRVSPSRKWQQVKQVRREPVPCAKKNTFASNSFVSINKTCEQGPSRAVSWSRKGIELEDASSAGWWRKVCAVCQVQRKKTPKRIRSHDRHNGPNNLDKSGRGLSI